ncbi:MAG: glycosyltransferase family 1 protein [Candidatus Hydrogenedentes bacterium]|nr:glycosyltransferase family 1 protein [Candidatus Hydrogenedentota bacterium]
MIAGIDYGPDAWPLPFAYADDRIPDLPEEDQRDGVFFAGKLIGGTRRLMLSWLNTFIEVQGGWGTPFTQEEYAALLREQAIGLCLFGNGFDTVRYWELPAHGVLLLAERSPLVIPHDFEDGRQAVFFDHAGELKEKLAHYLAHPDEALAIAQAGHAHLREHHTATARARQLLGRIQARLSR